MFLATFVSALSLTLLRRVAISAGLVDIPSDRKCHNGNVPLVGGISILLGVGSVIMLLPHLMVHQYKYLLFSSALVFIGMLDDKLDIRATYRLGVLILISFWLVKQENIHFFHLGDLFGQGNIDLDDGALLFTTLAIIGCITAFNMLDGIDGLLGVLAMGTIGSLGILFGLSGNYDFMLFCLIFIAAMCPYILLNLDLKSGSRYKVFMGDAGSFLVGFTVIWLLMFATQPINKSTLLEVMHPVTALWLMAVPLMDMTLVIVKRLYNKQSPLKADRRHIHHVLMNFGLSARKSLIVIGTFSLSTAVIGLFLQLSGSAESTILLLFFQLFILYCAANLWLEKKIQLKSVDSIASH
ncbi:UDP-N-acetylglucosamine--undecaprenyl-phosphate N-acetylglucosaminephosphotransferase [Vibrio sp. 10N.286.49.B3]|uniref:UDP-N-acetylglucosamine--undecaprenyl-phosphate N-acetylglucosaminephosphotransferase n=1 Tax=Vibrio sp. 10N.286.49.B3 TaxID=1880855 RepID=UPI0012FFEE2A|nr:UDP-N-acetylglucosamine--undecaprenyl-phosphate N-acetylglucosaminephosphotransferase [Vibrio sp. 10N.286.49.B3]